MQIEIATLSNIGGRDVNEDASGVWSTAASVFCVVSDGAGGHGGGDVASKLAVTTALQWFERTPECSSACVRGALGAANAAILERQRDAPALAHMRATAVVLCCDSRSRFATWGHIGDSRLYHFRDRRIVLQTRDHSVVQSMIDAGYMPQAELRAAPHRSRLFAALGEREDFEPAVGQAEIAEGDLFLLCTDGVWEHVDEAELERSLATAGTLAEWLAAIEREVTQRDREQQDNYSAVAVLCGRLAAAED